MGMYSKQCRFSSIVAPLQVLKGNSEQEELGAVRFAGEKGHPPDPTRTGGLGQATNCPQKNHWCLLEKEGMDPYSSLYIIPMIVPKTRSLIPYEGGGGGEVAR